MESFSTAQAPGSQKAFPHLPATNPKDIFASGVEGWKTRAKLNIIQRRGTKGRIEGGMAAAYCAMQQNLAQPPSQNSGNAATATQQTLDCVQRNQHPIPTVWSYQLPWQNEDWVKRQKSQLVDNIFKIKEIEDWLEWDIKDMTNIMDIEEMLSYFRF